METMRQLVPGSGEGQHTETADDSHRMERREAHAMRSPSLLVTIFYYSIPSGMLRGASYIINPLELTAHSADFVANPGVFSCGPQLSGSVRPQPRRIGQCPHKQTE
jgi:hypothetical protein